MQTFQFRINSYLLTTFLIVLFVENLFSQDHWETAIFADDNWRYILPSSELPSDWNMLIFNDSSWDQGPGGFGYSDGDDGTVINTTISVYLRNTFYITDLHF